MLKRLLIVCFCLTLVGCGFHLRGTQPLALPLQRIYLQSASPYDLLVLQLKQSLQSAGVTVVPSMTAAPVTFQILGVAFNQHLMNISTNTLVKTFQLSYEVVFQLKNARGQVIYGPQKVTARSTYVLNENQILGDNDVLAQEKQNLVREAIGLIYNYLNARDVRHALLVAKKK